MQYVFFKRYLLYSLIATFLSIISISAQPAISSVDGDTNLDGKVTYEDALLAFQYALMRKIPDPLELLAADINKDGAITASDVQEILVLTTGKSGIAGLNSNSYTGQFKAKLNPDLIPLPPIPALEFEKKQGQAGQSIILPIMLTFKEQEAKPGTAASPSLIPLPPVPAKIKAFMMDIQYDPAELTYAGENKQEALIKDFHLVSSNEYQPGYVRLCAVPFLAGGVDTEGALIHLQFQVNANAMPGSTKVVIVKTYDDLASATFAPGEVTVTPPQAPVQNWVLY